MLTLLFPKPLSILELDRPPLGRRAYHFLPYLFENVNLHRLVGHQALPLCPSLPAHSSSQRSILATDIGALWRRELFGNLHEARVILESWRVEYNERRMHDRCDLSAPSITVH